MNMGRFGDHEDSCRVALFVGGPDSTWWWEDNNNKGLVSTIADHISSTVLVLG